ncbi:FlgO family outer membrane protein [Gayadomonas joobiniege]|uniref:FlgO family outer membrane protein n=1 Tax=Gayadomonas joobiniege TaxID=1234606 RepID=UPI00036B1968|nr:FlgO family outer membrane protein [Gayadomonas joobiniege]
MRKQLIIIQLGLFSLLAACSYTQTHSYQTLVDQASPPPRQAQFSADSIKAYTYRLADELLLSLQETSFNGRLMVVPFVDAQTLSAEDAVGRALSGLNAQLENSFIYEMQHRGFNLVDYKLTGKVIFKGQSESIWSRDLGQLQHSTDADYLLSGTLTEHEQGVIVNVRLIRLENKLIAGTASGFIPRNVFVSQRQVYSGAAGIQQGPEPIRIQEMP